MHKSVIAYDQDLPEIPGRRPWEAPTCFLVKDNAAPGGWRVDNSGRRPSKLLLVNKLRVAVDRWRAGDPSLDIEPYAGASEVTKTLFRYWFEEDHAVPGFPAPLRYYFCQREAIETLAYVVEVAKIRDAKTLIDTYAEVFRVTLMEDNIVHETTMDGQRRLRRYFPELGRAGVQDLPPENLPRYAFKMATGSGKTWVVAMAIVWSHYHKRRVPGSPLSTNFLIVAPNVIVYQRLEKDFASNRIFHELPLVPPEWRPWRAKVILRGESAEPNPSGNIFLTNIQQLYLSRDADWTPANPVEVFLGRKPVKDLVSHQRSTLERLRTLRDLVVINDEAHHVHDEDLQWSQSLLSLHDSLPQGLSLWLDFSATPKDQNGMYYPWNLVDYPLAQAVEDRIVKAPLIVTKEDDPRRPLKDPKNVTKANVVEKYGFWIRSAVRRLQTHRQAYRKLRIKPVLFIMAERNAYADAIGQYLYDTEEFEFKKPEVLIIHTDSKGKLRKKDVERLRIQARDIDEPKSRTRAIVSVMMLREGWDVRNVTVVLGLRPFTTKSEILPEQVIGRGLRIMRGVGPDHTQTLEVLGTQNLLNLLRTELEAEGVGAGTAKTDPVLAITIEALLDRAVYDIALPITKPVLTHNTRILSSLDPLSFSPIYDQTDLGHRLQDRLKMLFATTDTLVHVERVSPGDLPMSQALVSSITNKVIGRAKLTNVFSALYPIVRVYLANRCFGRSVDLDNDIVRSYLGELPIQEAIARYLARKISELTIERRTLLFENARHKLSDTKPFHWRRNLKPEPLVCTKTVFNYVATYNPYERRFAQFLDQTEDVLRFASLGTTEQDDSASQFRVDYLKPSGAIGFYHPDWVAVEQIQEGEVNWILETKGRVWEGTTDKDQAAMDWCARISHMTDQQWRFARIDQMLFDTMDPNALGELVTAQEKERGQRELSLRG